MHITNQEDPRDSYMWPVMGVCVGGGKVGNRGGGERACLVSLALEFGYPVVPHAWKSLGG